MSNFNDLKVIWRAPGDCTNLDLTIPRVNASAIEVLETNLVSAQIANKNLRAVFDINHTLGIFDHSEFTFYPRVLEELCELLKVVPVALISGDQLEVINQKLIPVLNSFLKTNYSDVARKTIFENLIIYAQTGIKVLNFCEKGTPKEKSIPAAELSTSERNFILEQIIPIILYEFCEDPRFKLLPEQFKTPNTTVDNSEESSPLYTQCSSEASIELSVFGIHKGKQQQSLKKLLNEHKELRELRDDIVDRCSILLENHSVNAQLGGSTTVDFRKFDKAQAVYRYLAGLPEWEGELALIGVGDSFGPKGNDLAFSMACSFVYDVSENHQNAENALKVMRLIRKYTK